MIGSDEHLCNCLACTWGQAQLLTENREPGHIDRSNTLYNTIAFHWQLEDKQTRHCLSRKFSLQVLDVNEVSKSLAPWLLGYLSIANSHRRAKL